MRVHNIIFLGVIVAFVLLALLVLLSASGLILPARNPSTTPTDYDVFRLLAVLFTFATLIIGLFGIINYFQTADGVKRLAEVERQLLWSERELIVARVFARLLTNIRIDRRSLTLVPIVADNFFMASYIQHLFRIANSADLNSGDDEYEVVSSFLELSKIGGYPMCRNIVDELCNLGPYNSRYNYMVKRFRGYLPSMERNQ